MVELEHTSGTSEEQLPVLFKRGWWNTQEGRALRLNSFVARVLDANPQARRVTLTTPACSGLTCPRLAVAGAADDWPDALREPRAHSLHPQENNLARMAEEIADWAPKFLDLDPVHGVGLRFIASARASVSLPEIYFVQL